MSLQVRSNFWYLCFTTKWVYVFILHYWFEVTDCIYILTWKLYIFLWHGVTKNFIPFDMESKHENVFIGFHFQHKEWVKTSKNLALSLLFRNGGQLIVKYGSVQGKDLSLHNEMKLNIFLVYNVCVWDGDNIRGCGALHSPVHADQAEANHTGNPIIFGVVVPYIVHSPVHADQAEANHTGNQIIFGVVVPYIPQYMQIRQKQTTQVIR